MKKHTLISIIEKANKTHNCYYNYSLVEYNGYDKKIKISCPVHGIFEQTPHHHIDGRGCPICKGLKKITTDEFIKKGYKVHANFYDYSLVNYINNATKVKIICPVHGIFEQRPNDHINKKTGCRKCLTCSFNDFIKISNKRHNERYDYSLVSYRVNNDKINIICPVHGVFEQTVQHHLQGNGCPTCRESKGEIEITKYLTELNINFIKQYRFNDCRDKQPLPFDFYLPDNNFCVEYDGEQHFRPINYWGGLKGFELIKKRDTIKTEYCKKHNINLIRISFLEDVKEKLKNSSIRSYN